MYWNEVFFCPDDCIDGLSAKSVVEVLSGEGRIFPADIAKVFIRRYSIMRNRRLFMQSCRTHSELWKQGDLCLADVERYRDALLEIPATHPVFRGNEEWNRILTNPCVGHDLPIWMHGPKQSAKHRVMIVAQDPLRTGHGTGKLLISTPFGFHSAAYRDNDGGLLMPLALRLMEVGCTLYFTDVMKIYNRKPEPLKFNKKTRKCESPCKGCLYYDECMVRRNEIGKAKKNIQRVFKTRYDKCISCEIHLFKPDVIVTFGEPAARALLPATFGHKNNKKLLIGNGLNRSTFLGMVAPIPWSANYAGIPTLSFLHPSRTNSNALKSIGGADKFIGYCTDSLNDFFNKKKGQANEKQ